MHQLPTHQPVPQLPSQQLLLLLQLDQDALVLMSSSGGVGQHLVHGAVGHVLVYTVARLAWG